MDCATGNKDDFHDGLLKLYQKHEWNWQAAGTHEPPDPLLVIEEAAAKNTDKKKQKEFLKKKFKEWGGLKDNGETKDKKKNEARYNARLLAFFEFFVGEEAAAAAAEYHGKDEDTTFAELFKAYAINKKGVPGLSIDQQVFVLESFYWQYNPDKLDMTLRMREALEADKKTLDDYLDQLCNSAAYAEKGAVRDDWNGELYSKGVLTYLFGNFLAAAGCTDVPAGIEDAIARLAAEADPPPQIFDVLAQLAAEYNTSSDGWDPEDLANPAPALRERGEPFPGWDGSGGAGTEEGGGDEDGGGDGDGDGGGDESPAAEEGSGGGGGGGGGSGGGGSDQPVSHPSFTSQHQQQEQPPPPPPQHTAASPALEGSFRSNAGGSVRGSVPAGSMASGGAPSHEQYRRKKLWLDKFFEEVARRDGHRSAQLAADQRPLLDILSELYESYNVPPDDRWEFERLFQFKDDELLEDYRQRLSEFLQQNTTHRPGEMREYIERNAIRAVENHLTDAEFWPHIYTDRGVGFSVRWPPSRLRGAPPARSPEEVCPQDNPIPLVASRRGSMHSNRSGAGGGGGGVGLSRRDSIRSVASHVSAGGTRRSSAVHNGAGGGGMVMAIPGIVRFRSLDLTRVSDSESFNKLKQALRFDLMKNFGHPLDDTVIDTVRGGLMVAEFHFRARKETAHHVHASANMTLQKANLQFPSLSQEYKQVTGTAADAGVSYDSTDIRAPLSLRDHEDNLKRADKNARAELRDKLAFFHVKHAPSDISNVDLLMSESKLDELHLFSALFTRYGLGPYDGSYAGDEWRQRQQSYSRSQQPRGGAGGSSAVGGGGSALGDLQTRLAGYFRNLPAEHPGSWGAFLRANPARVEEKVEEAVLTLQTTGVTEDELLRRLDATYRDTLHPVHGGGAAAGTAASVGGPGDDERLRKRLTDFYATHNPAELYKVELAMQAGLSEDVLFARLHEKYGLPPPIAAEAHMKQQQQLNQHQLFSSGAGALVQQPELEVRRRQLDEDALALEGRERLLLDREVALEQGADAQARAFQMREDALAEWERQVLKREDGLRVREEQHQKMQSGRPSRSMSPAPGSAGGGGAGAVEVAAKLHEQEHKLQMLSERLEAQSRQVAEREEVVAAREGAVSAKEASLQGHAAAGQIIQDHLRSLEEREKIVTAKEVAILQSSVSQKEQDQALAHREMSLAKLGGDAAARDDEVRAREVRAAELLHRCEEREAAFVRREAELEERHRRFVFAQSEQASLSVQHREMEESLRALEVREQMLVQRERAIAERERQVCVGKWLSQQQQQQQQRQQTAEKDFAHQSAQSQEEASYLERERLLSLREDDLKVRMGEVELRELEVERLRRDVTETEVRPCTKNHHPPTHSFHTPLTPTQRTVRHAEEDVTRAADDARIAASGCEARQQELEARQRQQTSLEASLAEREEKLVLKETVLHEREKVLHRRHDEAERRGRFADELHSTVARREELVGTGYAELDKRAHDSTELNARLARIRERAAPPMSPTRLPPGATSVVRGSAPKSSIQSDLDAIRSTLASLSLTPKKY